MPALRLRSGQAAAGIQEPSAWAARDAAWIPGLALLARNDGKANPLRISCAQD
jgi:hypothetical protein